MESPIFLLLGGNKLNSGIYEKFHRRGYKVYVIDWNKRPFITGECHYQIDVKDYKSIIYQMQKDGVWSQVVFAYSSIDAAVPSVTYINRAIGLNTLSDEALDYAVSKSKMTQKWKREGLLNRSSEKLYQYSLTIFYMSKGKALIVKPDNSASSRGITILFKNSSKEQCKAAYEKAKIEATNGIVIVEEFVEGSEFTVEMIGDSEGNVCVYGVSKKSHTENVDNNKIAVKLLYNAIPKELMRKIAEFGIACYKALGFTASLGHLEVIVKKDGTITPIEIGARSSGFIASDLVDVVSGSDYLADLIEVQKGMKVINGMHKQSLSAAAYFFYDFPEGAVVHKEMHLMNYVNRSIISRYYDRSEIYLGHKFGKIENDNERYGFEILEGPRDLLTTEYLEEKEREMINDIIKMELEPG